MEWDGLFESEIVGTNGDTNQVRYVMCVSGLRGYDLNWFFFCYDIKSIFYFCWKIQFIRLSRIGDIMTINWKKNGKTKKT